MGYQEKFHWNRFTGTISLRRHSIELTSLQGALQAQLSPEHFTMLVEEITSQVARTYYRRRNELTPKFLDLRTPRQANRTPKVINLSQRTLNSAESSILERGMKFNTADADTASFIGNLESILSHPTIPKTFFWTF